MFILYILATILNWHQHQGPHMVARRNEILHFISHCTHNVILDNFLIASLFIKRHIMLIQIKITNKIKKQHRRKKKGSKDKGISSPRWYSINEFQTQITHLLRWDSSQAHFKLENELAYPSRTNKQTKTLLNPLCYLHYVKLKQERRGKKTRAATYKSALSMTIICSSQNKLNSFSKNHADSEYWSVPRNIDRTCELRWHFIDTD